MTRVLVLGRGGQLALSLAERAAAGDRPFSFVGRPDIDLERPETLRRSIAESDAGVIVNAAAYTAVDLAEDEPERAHAVNAVAPGIMAAAAREAGARLVHFSTDYVFDGSGERPWTENDRPAPLGVYGRTKLDGEAAVRAEHPEGHVILRTAWVYSPFGRNFVGTMLALARTHPHLNVVGDQVGNPTSALDLADAVLAMLAAWDRAPQTGLGATYHLAGPEAVSWARFAEEIFAISRSLGGPSASVEAIASSAWPARAPRPLNSRLNSERFAQTFGYRAPPLRNALQDVVERLVRGSSGPGTTEESS